MNHVRTIGIIGAIVVAALTSSTGVTAATAAPTTAIVRTSAVGGVAPVRTAALQTTLPAPTPPDGRNSTDRVSIAPIVNWIKNNAPSILSGMKSAVRKGLNAFKSWWAGVAGWIKAAITAIANLSVSELFSALWNYFFG